MSGDFQFAADTRGCMHELDFAAELVGYEIANHAGAVSRASRWHHGRAAALLPPDRKPALGVSVSSLAPAHRDMAALGRKGAEFCGIGGELVEDHRNCLTRLCAQDLIRPADLQIAARGVGCEL